MFQPLRQQRRGERRFINFQVDSMVKREGISVSESVWPEAMRLTAARQSGWMAFAAKARPDDRPANLSLCPESFVSNASFMVSNSKFDSFGFVRSAHCVPAAIITERNN